VTFLVFAAMFFVKKGRVYIVGIENTVLMIIFLPKRKLEEIVK
jgi:hypothetical protein